LNTGDSAIRSRTHNPTATSSAEIRNGIRPTPVQELTVGQLLGQDEDRGGGQQDATQRAELHPGAESAAPG